MARTVDASLTMPHWHIGRRIREDMRQSGRTNYGWEIIPALGRQLSVEFGRGFDEKSLRHMIKFAEAFPDKQIVSPPARQLSLGRSGIPKSRLLRDELNRAPLGHERWLFTMPDGRSLQRTGTWRYST